VVLLARSYELAGELDDPERARAVLLAFGDASWELPAPLGLSGQAAIDWRLAGGLVLGVPVPEVGEGESLPHAGVSKFTGYAAGGTRVVTSLTQRKDEKESPFQLSDARTGDHFATLPAANTLVFSPNARHVYYGGRLTWGIWDTQRKVGIGPDHDKDQHPGSAAFNHDGTRLLYIGLRSECEVWDPNEPRRISLDPIHAIQDVWGRSRYPVALSPNGTHSTHLFGRGALFWHAGEKIEPRDLLSKVRKTTTELTAAAYSLDGANVYVATEKTTESWTTGGVRIGDWLPASGVRQIVFSPNGRQVVLVNSDGARLWDVDSKRPIGPARHPGATRIQFRPDGRQLLTVSDRQARLWPHPTVDPTRRGLAARLWAEATAGLQVEADGQIRPLSDSERADRRIQFAELAGLPAK
jgi:hypothetical protein